MPGSTSPGERPTSWSEGAALPLARALHVAIQVCDAVGEAHVQGIVHRDIKPENVMVRDDGVVKVLDFGVVKRLSRDDTLPGSAKPYKTMSVSETASGLVLGTPRYLSPEQVRGDAIDGRTDQFGWGVVAYEMITGRRASQALAIICF